MRACDDIQGNDVIGRSGKGYSTRIAFDLNDPVGAGSACRPDRGALTNKPINGIPTGRGRSWSRSTRCARAAAGTSRARRGGCASRPLRLGLRGLAAAADRALIRVESACPKGPLSADVSGNTNGKGGAHKEDGRPGKDRGRKPGGLIDFNEVMAYVRETTWEEALDPPDTEFPLVLNIAGCWSTQAR